MGLLAGLLMQFALGPSAVGQTVIRGAKANSRNRKPCNRAGEDTSAFVRPAISRAARVDAGPSRGAARAAAARKWALRAGAFLQRCSRNGARHEQHVDEQTWTALGPAAVQTPDFGLVTGRVAAIALDPSDATGNRLYIGTTGGGVWRRTMRAHRRSSADRALRRSPTRWPRSAESTDASISIGALTVQPGGTGVILAGTGDPNDVLDSYYGAGILRSTDGGNTWSLIQQTSDLEDGAEQLRTAALWARALRALPGAP